MPDHNPDRYLIPAGPGGGEFKDRGSKFVARLAHVRDEVAALAIVEEEAIHHHKCNHHCYAYRIGEGEDRWRANDDGEPSGTAGRPILGQIDKAGLSDVVIVVSRYFGGTKLGASGLINAYREAAALAVTSVGTDWQALTETVHLRFGYELMTPVMSALSQLNLEMTAQNFGTQAEIQLDLPRSEAATTVRELKARIAGVYLGEVDDDFLVEGLVVC
ncbi:IMPACT family protein [Neolewinella antarctica]|uniref:YigZ family protein n=1 Tax=Neolewinella antarctica TaxID=442734 RepID=A0ABX0X8F3_9BACT|nr:YigZ family protein [Neolewinella antarctica]NJC25530.1 putative YigZ family protein [Neolewinella antarctica]